MGQRISNIQTLTVSVDLNKVIFPGQYILNSSVSYTNNPAPQGAATLYVTQVVANASYIQQRLEVRANNVLRIYNRFGLNSNGNSPLGGTMTWFNWEEFISPSADYSTTKNFTTTGSIKAGRLESTGVITTTGTITGGKIDSTGSISATQYVSSGAFTVAALPSSPPVGSWAFATNGCKNGEATGAGTGCPVYFQGVWKTFYDNTQVKA